MTCMTLHALPGLTLIAHTAPASRLANISDTKTLADTTTSRKTGDFYCLFRTALFRPPAQSPSTRTPRRCQSRTELCLWKSFCSRRGACVGAPLGTVINANNSNNSNNKNNNKKQLCAFDITLFPRTPHSFYHSRLFNTELFLLLLLLLAVFAFSSPFWPSPSTYSS